MQYAYRPKSLGSQRLQEWIAQRGLKAAWVNSQFPQSKAYVYRWLSGNYCPSIAQALKIEGFTEGYVPVISWVQPPNLREEPPPTIAA